MKMHRIITLVFTALFLVSCSPELQKIGAQMLGSTGYVTGDQAEKALGAVSDLAKQEEYTPMNEWYLGRAVAANILVKYRLYSNDALKRYVSKVGLILANNSDQPETFGGYRFFVLDSDEVNAMAAPGGFIFVSRGLIKLLPDEDALAAVLAHEIGHIVKRHGVEAIDSATKLKSLTELASVGASVAISQMNSPIGNVGALTDTLTSATEDIVQKLIEDGFSRSDEYEADEYAVELLRRSNYNPQALRILFDALAKANITQGGWFSTHPSPEDRSDEVQDVLGETQTPSGMQVIRAQRFRRIVRVG